MESADPQSLQDEIKRKDEEIVSLREKLGELQRARCPHPASPSAIERLPGLSKAELSNADILRFSRQLVLPEFGVKGQLSLANTSVLVVGCGGLGCPLAQYLAAAGVGRLGLLDYDVVEMSNLHRQVLHAENRQGMSKSLSVVKSLQKLNSTVEYVPYHMMLNPETALELFKLYDIVADCSDNVPTRYLVNDASVAAGKPLVSASALRWDGQLTVYNYQGGPCYRCLFPNPPPPETITNCADGGVLGIVPGIIGSLQALEVLKIASGIPSSYSGVLLMYNALDGRFRNIKIRSKKPDCVVCSDNSEYVILKDYETFCGSSASDRCRILNLLSREERLSVQDYKNILDNGHPHILVDVRPQVEVDICRLPHSVHIPLSRMEECNDQWLNIVKDNMAKLKHKENEKSMVVMICKNGNDSQKAVKILQKSQKEVDLLIAKDVQGGLIAWSKIIDPTFPEY
ncbi:adenylyltransferase and sulfurtransferase MOCS3 [Pelobates cultripes]|uniref:Adenylyltransferase and sulfurtransferase MOCS3 n=1 Tax=Pelobates cultripes TaxID=61616 RepID=A0AAD1VQH7_PELCU|nr:adenylyltransferase and sulfurtransferase MOCS3 [Pelobates cultripes]